VPVPKPDAQTGDAPTAGPISGEIVRGEELGGQSVGTSPTLVLFATIGVGVKVAGGDGCLEEEVGVNVATCCGPGGADVQEIMLRSISISKAVRKKKRITLSFSFKSFILVNN
jgi:hypothetical protein